MSKLTMHQRFVRILYQWRDKQPGMGIPFGVNDSRFIQFSPKDNISTYASTCTEPQLINVEFSVQAAETFCDLWNNDFSFRTKIANMLVQTDDPAQYHPIIKNREGTNNFNPLITW